MFYKIAGVLKGVFKFPQISLEDTCAGYNVDVKVWFYPFSLIKILKILLHTVVFQWILQKF